MYRVSTTKVVSKFSQKVRFVTLADHHHFTPNLLSGSQSGKTRKVYPGCINLNIYITHNLKSQELMS